jgi:hypothetical protein
MDLLPTPIVEGLGPTTPAMARFLVQSASAKLAPDQKRPGETDLEYLDRVDAEYAAFTATLKE